MDITKIVSTAIQVSDEKDKEPILTYLEGIEGIKNIYLDTLKLPKGETIYAVLNPEKVHPEIYHWLTTDYVKLRVKKGIYAHVFVTGGQDSERTKLYKELDTKENRTTHIVEAYDKPFECEINIYGDKVAFINYNPKGKLVGIIIHHKIIVSTLKAFYLHYLWKF